LIGGVDDDLAELTPDNIAAQSRHQHRCTLLRQLGLQLIHGANHTNRQARLRQLRLLSRRERVKGV